MYGVNLGRRGLSSELYFDADVDLNMARFNALDGLGGLAALLARVP